MVSVYDDKVGTMFQGYLGHQFRRLLGVLCDALQRYVDQTAILSCKSDTYSYRAYGFGLLSFSKRGFGDRYYTRCVAREGVSCSSHGMSWSNIFGLRVRGVLAIFPRIACMLSQLFLSAYSHPYRHRNKSGYEFAYHARLSKVGFHRAGRNVRKSALLVCGWLDHNKISSNTYASLWAVR